MKKARIEKRPADLSFNVIRLAINARQEIEKVTASVYDSPIAGHKIVPIEEPYMEMEDHHIEKQ